MLLAANKEFQKRCKDIWTKDVIEVYGENFQRLIKESCLSQQNNPPREIQPWKEKKKKQRIALQKLNAKKYKKHVLSTLPFELHCPRALVFLGLQCIRCLNSNGLHFNLE